MTAAAAATTTVATTTTTTTTPTSTINNIRAPPLPIAPAHLKVRCHGLSRATDPRGEPAPQTNADNDMT